MQLEHSIAVRCEGRPSAGNDREANPRVTCNARKDLAFEGTFTTKKMTRVVGKLLRGAGWRNFRTLEERAWTCPRCSNFILGQRRKNFGMWGNFNLQDEVSEDA